MVGLSPSATVLLLLFGALEHRQASPFIKVRLFAFVFYWSIRLQLCGVFYSTESDLFLFKIHLDAILGYFIYIYILLVSYVDEKPDTEFSIDIIGLSTFVCPVAVMDSPGHRSLPVLTYENLDGKIAVWVWLCVPPYSLMCYDRRNEQCAARVLTYDRALRVDFSFRLPHSLYGRQVMLHFTVHLP
jgi:hypothetical protein